MTSVALSIEATLKAGEFALKDDNGKSDIWKTFAIVYDGENEMSYTACKTCTHVYSKNHSTSHTWRHKCGQKSVSAVNKITAFAHSQSVPKAAKALIEDKCVSYVC